MSEDEIEEGIVCPKCKGKMKAWTIINTNRHKLWVKCECGMETGTNMLNLFVMKPGDTSRV